MDKFYHSFSENVGKGHPDRVADILASIVIDDIQHKDKFASHAAIEVFLTHDTVIFGGEATTTIDLNEDYLKEVVKKGFEKAGYLPEMRKYWTKEQVMLAEDMKIVNKIEPQSPDIALGTTAKEKNSGWNDQGIMFSSAENTNKYWLGIPTLLSKIISDALADYSRESILNGYDIVFGPDIKVVVTCITLPDGFRTNVIDSIVVAQSHTDNVEAVKIEDKVKEIATKAIESTKYLHGCQLRGKEKWVINGTGRFTIMGCVSDTSMTGRKISVNHPGAGPLWSNKMIGGGSLVKCYHASDFILNVASRFVANVIVRANVSDYAIVGCACAIGQKELASLFIKMNDSVAPELLNTVEDFFKTYIDWTPEGLTNLFGILNEDFSFVDCVANNFFGDKMSQPWEGDMVGVYAWELIDFLELKGFIRR